MAVKNCTQAYNSFLTSFRSALNQSWNLAPEYLQQFKENQLEFYQQISLLSSDRVQDLEHICTSLNEVVQKTKEAEFRFIQENNSYPERCMVTTLRSIAGSLRSGQEGKALEEFRRSISDRKGSIEGEVYGCLWKVRGRPNYVDFGRFSFNNTKPDCVSTPLQKALAIEMALIGVIRKAFEEGQPACAYAEFHELPNRMKEEIFQILAQKKSLLSGIEEGRKWFFDQNMEIKTKINFLIVYQDALESKYSRASDCDHVRILQHEIQREETAIKHPQETKLELFEQLRSTELAALKKLQKLQSQENLTLRSQVKTLESQNNYLKQSILTKKIQLLQQKT